MRFALALGLILLTLAGALLAAGRHSAEAPGARNGDGGAVLIEVATGRRLALSGAGSQAASLQFDAAGNRLVYSLAASDGAGSRILQVDLDDGPLQTREIGEGANPVVSARGDLAFETGADGEARLQVVPAGDGAPLTLACAPCRPVTWSPDGGVLGYRRAPDSYAFGFDAAVSAGVYPDEDAVVGVVWLDGRHALVFSGQAYQTPSRLDYAVVDVETGRTASLLQNVDFAVTDWSAARQELLAASLLSSDDEVRILRRDGSVRLAGLAGESPRWSAGGDYVLTRVYAGECAHGLVIYAADSGERRHCLRGEAGDPLVGALAPDDAVLAYARPDGDAYDLLLLDLMSGEQTALARVGGRIACLHWSPDGRWLAGAERC